MIVSKLEHCYLKNVYDFMLPQEHRTVMVIQV